MYFVQPPQQLSSPSTFRALHQAPPDLARIQAASHLLLLVIHHHTQERTLAVQHDLANLALAILEHWTRELKAGRGLVPVGDSGGGSTNGKAGTGQ